MRAYEDAESIAAAQKREAQIRGWVPWLRGIRWSYVATGNFSHPLLPGSILETVRTWLDAIPPAYISIGRAAYAAVGVQRGRTERYHVHLLLGAVKREHLVEVWLRDSWRRDGHLLVDGYHPARGFVEYLVEQADEIELFGTLRPYRPHR